MKNEVRDDAGAARGLRRRRRGARSPRRCAAPSAAAGSSPSGSSPTSASSAGTPSGATSSSSRPCASRWSRSLELVRGYLASDYDYPTAIAAMRARHRGGVGARSSTGLDGRRAGGDARGQRDQPADGAAHARPPLLHRPGRERPRPAGADRDRPASWSRRGALDDADDVMFLRYNELRVLIGDAGGDRRARRSSPARRAEREARRRGQAARLGRHRHRRRSSPSRTSSTGATRSGSTAGSRPRPAARITGHRRARRASSRASRGSCRTVDEFDEVTDGDILVCQMTNPAWVVLFTKIAGLVTDTGGTTSHPAVLAREFGIPAVVGTSDATPPDRDRRPDPGRRVARASSRSSSAPARAGAGRGAARRVDRILRRPPVTVAGRLPRSVLADQVKERLLEGILAAATRPDARIVETQVARELGTSQAPVREALRGLEALGVVEITPFRGARVRRPTRRELLEAYGVRSALEALGARLAVPRLDAEAIDELPGTSSDMEAAALAGDGRHGRRGGRPVPRPDRRARRQRDAGEAVALARAVLADLHHAHRARRRPRVVGRAPRADPRGAPGAGRRRRRRRAGRHFAEVSANMADRDSEDTMNDTPQLTEEMAAGAARLRIDVLGGEPREHVLDDMSFMNYRLADVRDLARRHARRARHRRGARTATRRSPTTGAG